MDSTNLPDLVVFKPKHSWPSKNIPTCKTRLAPSPSSWQTSSQNWIFIPYLYCCAFPGSALTTDLLFILDGTNCLISHILKHSIFHRSRIFKDWNLFPVSFKSGWNMHDVCTDWWSNQSVKVQSGLRLLGTSKDSRGPTWFHRAPSTVSSCMSQIDAKLSCHGIHTQTSPDLPKPSKSVRTGPWSVASPHVCWQWDFGFNVEELCPPLLLHFIPLALRLHAARASTFCRRRKRRSGRVWGYSRAAWETSNSSRPEESPHFLPHASSSSSHAVWRACWLFLFPPRPRRLCTHSSGGFLAHRLLRFGLVARWLCCSFWLHTVRGRSCRETAQF